MVDDEESQALLLEMKNRPTNGSCWPAESGGEELFVGAAGHEETPKRMVHQSSSVALKSASDRKATSDKKSKGSSLTTAIDL